MSKRPLRYRKYPLDIKILVMNAPDPWIFVSEFLPESTLRGWLRNSNARSSQFAVLKKSRRHKATIKKLRKILDRNKKCLNQLKELIGLLVFNHINDIDFKTDKQLIRVFAQLNDKTLWESEDRSRFLSWRNSLNVRAKVTRSKSVLTKTEVKIMRRYLESPKFANLGVRTLARIAQRDNKLHATEQTWYRYIKSLGVSRPFGIKTKKCTNKKGLRASCANEYWHVDVTYWPLANRVSKAVIGMVVDNYSRMILGSIVLEKLSSEGIVKLLRRSELKTKTLNYLPTNVTVVSDNGTENRARPVRKFIRERPAWRHQIARRDISESNACVESVFKLLKQRFLRRHKPGDIEMVNQYVRKFVLDYNKHIPHNALHGATPLEVYTGTKPEDVHAANKVLRRRAQLERSARRNLEEPNQATSSP